MMFKLLGRTLHIYPDVGKCEWSNVHVIHPQRGDVGDVVGGEVAAALTFTVMLLGPDLLVVALCIKVFIVLATQLAFTFLRHSLCAVFVRVHYVF